MKAYQNSNAVRVFSNEDKGRELLKKIRESRDLNKKVSIEIGKKRYTSQEL